MIRHHKSTWSISLVILIIVSVFLSACSGNGLETEESVTETTSSQATQSSVVVSEDDIYEQALDLCEAGRFFEASAVFAGLSGFRDAAELSEQAWRSMLLVPVLIDGKWGYIDNYDNLVLPPAYDEAKPFYDGQALVRIESDWQLIDAWGNTTGKIHEEWLEVGPFTCGLATFSQVDQTGRIFYGSIDYHGNVVFGPYSDIPIYFIDNTAMVLIDYMRYYLDIAGNIYSPGYYFYQIPEGFENTLVSTSTVHMNSYYMGTFTSAGPVWDEPSRTFGGNGYFYADGTLAIPLKFSSCGDFNHGMAPVLDFNGKYGYIDRQGDYVIDPVYEYAGVFSQGLAVIKVDGLFGYINTNGETVIEPQFFNARDFQEGLAAVQVKPFLDEQNGWGIYAGWGFIDRTGTLAIEPQFGDVYDSGFLGGYCAVAEPISEAAWKSDWSSSSEVMKYGFIDTSGNWKVRPRYGWIAGVWPGGYLAEGKYSFFGNQSSGHIRYDFSTNNGESIVAYIPSSGRAHYQYYGPDGYIDELTPYDQDVVLTERFQRPVEIWENLYMSLFMGPFSLTQLPQESQKTYNDMTVYRDETQSLYGYYSLDGSIDVPARYQEMGHFGNCSSSIEPSWLRDPINTALSQELVDASTLNQIYIESRNEKTQDLATAVYVVNLTLNGQDRYLLTLFYDMLELHGEIWEYYHDDRYIFFDYVTWWDIVFEASGEYEQQHEWEITPSEKLAKESENLSIVSVMPFASFYEFSTGEAFDNLSYYSRQQVWDLFIELVPEDKQLNIFHKVDIDDNVYVARGISLEDQRLVYVYLQYDPDTHTYNELITRTNLNHVSTLDQIDMGNSVQMMKFSEYYALADLPLQMTQGELIAMYEASFLSSHKKLFGE